MNTIELMALHKIESTADYKAVYAELLCCDSASLRLEFPGDDAWYLVELVIGDAKHQNEVTVCFSRFGNLCFLYGANCLDVPTPSLVTILDKHGWRVVSRDEAEQVADGSTGQTVHDLFFNYC